MQKRANLWAILATIALFTIAASMDQKLNALREQAGRTFDFQTPQIAYFAFVLTFGALVILFLHVIWYLARPSRWVFWVLVFIPSFILFNFLLGYVFYWESYALLMPSSLRGHMLEWMLPGKFTAPAITIMLWMGVAGILKSSHRETP